MTDAKSGDHEEGTPFLAWKAMGWDPAAKLLCSPSVKQDWTPRTALEAYCGTNHKLRQDDITHCGCGIYARKEIDRELVGYLKNLHFANRAPVLAQVAMWGWVIEGGMGYRSQLAYPRTILLHSQTEQYKEEIGTLYEVPVIIADEAFAGMDWPREGRRSRTVSTSTSTTPPSAKDIERARYQLAYHKWYNVVKRVQRDLKQWQHFQNAAPMRIQECTEKLAELQKLKPKKGGE